MTCQEKPSKSILKSEHEKTSTLGTYNIYTKRASFKDDVILQQFIQDKCEPTIPAVIEARIPMAPDVTEEELSPEEVSRRKEFKQKRRQVDLEGADGLNLKAVLAHRVSLPGVEVDDEVESENTDNTNESQQENKQIPNRSTCTTNNDSFSCLVDSSKQQSDFNLNLRNDTQDGITNDTINNISVQSDNCCLSYPVPDIVNTLSTSTITTEITTTTTSATSTTTPSIDEDNAK
ncbi:hypothetical protein KSF78_0007898 [Schistosoma japonicum]|nr:hypothetical protein KSF78_0007898 [Schistosoma japonicum]KAH8873099.1 hypothetical protein KSF78_0007898 [Schistosoma japonicum]KAH8873100.1 hypothetical protein KSF78_0007898 [Schistosoma japonicum]